MKGTLTWIFAIMLVVVLLVYAAGTSKVLTSGGSAATSFVKGLYGPGAYASGNVGG